MTPRKNARPPEKHQAIREAIIILTDKELPATLTRIARVMGLARSSALMSQIWDLADCEELKAETHTHRGKCPVRYTFTITSKGIEAWKHYKRTVKNDTTKTRKTNGTNSSGLERSLFDVLA